MTSSTPAMLLDALRTRTGERHREIESLPYLRALASGDLALESYAGHIRAMAVVHAALESALDGSADPLVRSVWNVDLRRLPALDSDLLYFRTRNLPDLPDAVEAACEIARRIRIRSQQNPVSLIGALYVIEGSMKGAAVLRRLVGRAFAFEGEEGVRYLAMGETALAGRWDTFVDRLGALALTDAQRDAILESAEEIYAGLVPVFRALHPIRPGTLTFLAPALNPEAGAHAVPSDPRELNAAIRAGEACWRRFPYYEARYAERGRRFTTSDSAWLVTLADAEPAAVNQQILWLGRVLAARGMPRYLLECQLFLLRDELAAAVPEKAVRYDRLAAAGRMLADRRAAQVAPARFDVLAAEFDALAAGDPAARLNVGPIVVAAVADDRDGVPGALTSIESWLTEPGRFSPVFVDAVRKTIARAQTPAG